MGERGPLPKPSALEELEGNPGKRAPNAREPKPPKVVAVEPPAWFSEQARSYWLRAVPILSTMGVLTEADLFLLERYCDFLADWKACRDFLSERGSIFYPIYDGDKIDPTTKKRVVKYLQEYPHVSKKLRVSEHLLKIESHFGMSPASRTRIMAEELYDPPPGAEPIHVDPFDPFDPSVH